MAWGGREALEHGRIAMDWRGIGRDVLIAGAICFGVYLVVVFSQGPGIQFVYFAF